MEGGKNMTVLLFGICGPKFMKFWNEVGDPGGFRPIANIAFFPKILVISLEVVKKQTNA